MSKQSKARNKAYRKAAEHEAVLQDYDRLSTAALEEWIKEYIDRHQETWNVVWSAANKWTNKWWVARQMAARDTAAKAEETLTRLEANLEAVTTTAALRLDKIRKQKEQIDQQMTANVALNRTNSDLRAQLDRLKRDFVTAGERFTMKALDEAMAKNAEQERTIRAQNTSIASLEGMLGDVKEGHRDTLKALYETQVQLERTRKHTTSATWKVFEENERLVAELRRVKTLLADAEETIRSWEGIKKAVPRQPLGPCMATMGAHQCTNLTRPGSEHPQRHLCHCGTLWS